MYINRLYIIAIIEIIVILRNTIVIVSCILISRMLPNRKLKRSNENPPDRLIRTIPTASPDESKIAIDESGGILMESVIFVIPNAAIKVKAYAVHIGYRLRNSPIDNPPKAT
jgi:hypothetical protein